jgi:hypothetical protein
VVVVVGVPTGAGPVGTEDVDVVVGGSEVVVGGSVVVGGWVVVGSSVVVVDGRATTEVEVVVAALAPAAPSRGPHATIASPVRATVLGWIDLSPISTSLRLSPNRRTASPNRRLYPPRHAE